MPRAARPHRISELLTALGLRVQEMAGFLLLRNKVDVPNIEHDHGASSAMRQQRACWWNPSHLQKGEPPTGTTTRVLGSGSSMHVLIQSVLQYDDEISYGRYGTGTV